MKKILIFLIYIVFLPQARGQHPGLNNLDKKYGFNKFKLEEPFSNYKSSCKFLYNDDNDIGVKIYKYTGPSINNVFGYFEIQNIHLYFYNNKLKTIEIEFNNLTQQNEKYIYTELTKLFDSPQKVGSPSEDLEFFYAWISDKTILYFIKDRMPSSTRINVSSFKLLMDIKNSKF